MNDGPRIGLRTSTSEICPGGPNSGCPGSRSRYMDLLLGSFVVKSALHSCRLNVDLPDDLGPIVMAHMEPFFSSALPVS